METIVLGKTGLIVGRTAFGALPIQRVPKNRAVRILKKALDGGIKFFDTTRAYTDSEEKLGCAFLGCRDKVIIATKTHAKTGKELLEHLEQSLCALKTDYVDILQFHNPQRIPVPGSADGLYEALMKARKKGMVLFSGISNHRLPVAIEAVKSGFYDVVQFPLSAISSRKDITLVRECEKHNVGLIAMKPLCGGLIRDAKVSFVFLRQHRNVVPIWGIQREKELKEILRLEDAPPLLDRKMMLSIRREREELAGDFCRGCGYCLPCPSEIPIPMAARMAFLLRRAPYRQFLTDQWRDNMERIKNCTLCGECRKRCPYGLDTPNLLRKMLADYREFYRAHHG